MVDKIKKSFSINTSEAFELKTKKVFLFKYDCY